LTFLQSIRPHINLIKKSTPVGYSAFTMCIAE
jgi:hypothetical protein